MSNKILIAFVVLLALSSSTIAQQRAVSLSGQVTDELGALVVGATVTVISSDNSEKSAVTSNEGIYTFNSLAPGRYTLKVVSPGFSDYSNSQVEVRPLGPTATMSTWQSQSPER
jgi:protocatechuate 3,4-dioxygenase beta subunit